MEEETLLLLAKHHSEISQYTYLLSPDLKKIEFVRDKSNLMQFAEKIGIPAREHFMPPVPSPPLRFYPIPAVIKPRISSGSLGIVYVKKREDLIPSYQKVHDRFPFQSFKNGFLMEGGCMVSLPFMMRIQT